MNADQRRLVWVISAFICVHLWLRFYWLFSYLSLCIHLWQKFLSVFGVGRACGGNLLFVLVADRQQRLLGVHQVAALLAVIFENLGFDDRIHRAGFLAESAVDALGQIDVIARGAARTVGAFLGLDGDGQRRAPRHAQLDGNAALLAVPCAAQRVQAAKA